MKTFDHSGECELQVGDTVKCISLPLSWLTNIYIGGIYEIAEVSHTVYAPDIAVQVLGKCRGAWFLSKRFIKLDSKWRGTLSGII